MGPVKDDGTIDQKFVVTSSGNVGIGTANPSQMLTLLAPEGNRLEIGRTSAALPWSPADQARPGAFVINQQSQGSTEPGADFALMRDKKKRVRYWIKTPSLVVRRAEASDFSSTRTSPQVVRKR